MLLPRGLEMAVAVDLHLQYPDWLGLGIARDLGLPLRPGELERRHEPLHLPLLSRVGRRWRRRYWYRMLRFR